MSDSEIKLKVSPSLLQVFKESAEKTVGAPANIERVLADGKGVVNVADIEWLQSQAQRGGPREEGAQLHSLLAGCEVQLPGPPVVPRNPELEARVRRLKDQQQDRLYRAMTKNVDSVRVKQPEDTIAYQVKQINRQLIAVLQFVFSVGAGFVFGFLGVELIVGKLDFGFRLLLGVICALVIALAEIYFLAKKLAEDFEVPVRPPVNLQPAAAMKPHTD